MLSRALAAATRYSSNAVHSGLQGPCMSRTLTRMFTKNVKPQKPQQQPRRPASRPPPGNAPAAKGNDPSSSAGPSKKFTPRKGQTQSDGRQRRPRGRSRRGPQSAKDGANQGQGHGEGKNPQHWVPPPKPKVDIPGNIVTIPDTPISVKDLGAMLSIRYVDVLKSMIRLGESPKSVADILTAEQIELVCMDYGVETISRAEIDAQEHDLRPAAAPTPEVYATFPLRPPIVTVMGHVDHGKTTLLDYLRNSNVAAREVGGITQHIGAFNVNLEGHVVTFLDTPGHEAFSNMRARGSKCTDLVILVVDAIDGIMPQTVEAINHAKSAGVPIILAVNKCDIPGARPEQVDVQLCEHGLLTESMGGDIQTVHISALKGHNMDKLRECILLQSEIMDLRSDPAMPAEGVVIESSMKKSLGACATVIVQRGTLNIGDSCVVGKTYGKVRLLRDDVGESVALAGPSTPVELVGLNELPEAGDILLTVPDEKRARQVCDFRSAQHERLEERRRTRERLKRLELQGDNDDDENGQVAKSIPLILKADVAGTVEAIREQLARISTSGMLNVNLLHSAVGPVSESDLSLAAASNALVLAFNVKPMSAAVTKKARHAGVDVRYHRIIYNLMEDVRSFLSSHLPPIREEVVCGRALVKALFEVGKGANAGTVAGCEVRDGLLVSTLPIRVKRAGDVVYEGHVTSMRHFTDEVSEVKRGMECGVMIDSTDGFAIKAGDEIECIEERMRARQLEL